MRESVTYKRLGDLCERLTDGSHNPPKGVTHSGYLMISSQNIGNDCIDLNRGVRYLTKEDFEQEDKRTRISEGDVLLTIVGTVGRAAVVHAEHKNITLQRSVAVLSPKKELINSSFLKYLLQAESYKLIEEAHGVAQKGIYLGQLSNISVPVPSLSTQELIVRELDSISSVISAKKQQVLELDNLAQAIFLDTFGDPITNPKVWEVKKIEEIAYTTSGGTPSKAHKEYYEGGTIPWLRSGEVSQGMIYKTELFITQEGLDNSNAKIVPIDTVAIAMYGATVGEVGIIKSPMCTNQAICNILPNEDTTPLYLMYVLMSMKPKYTTIAAGGAQPNISQAIIKNTAIPLPPLSLQQAFAEKVQAIEEQKRLINQSIAEFESLLAQRMEFHFA